jgi:hypothetical protein
VGLVLLIIEVSISRSVRLLWTSDRSRRDLHLTRDRYPLHGAIEAAVPASDWPQIHALDGVAIGNGWKSSYCKGKTEVLLIATKETGLEHAYLTSGSRTNCCTRRSFYVADEDVWNEKMYFIPWRHPSLCCEGHFYSYSYYQFTFIVHDVGKHKIMHVFICILIHCLVRWIPCFTNSDQILPKLPAPHKGWAGLI